VALAVGGLVVVAIGDKFGGSGSQVADIDVTDGVGVVGVGVAGIRDVGDMAVVGGDDGVGTVAVDLLFIGVKAYAFGGLVDTVVEKDVGGVVGVVGDEIVGV